jgi:hypothetical protein
MVITIANHCFMKIRYNIPAKSKSARLTVIASVVVLLFVVNDSVSAQENSVSTVSLVTPSIETKSNFVELVSFNAEQTENSKVFLKWSTAVEKNASHFVIQRSENGTTFYDQLVLLAEEGDRNTKVNYHFSDNTSTISTNGAIYYRLKIVTQNGKYSFSQSLKIKVKALQEQMRTL